MVLRVAVFILCRSLIATLSDAQVTCAQFGEITSCSRPRGSFDQVQLGNNQGVIVDNHTTTPYTIVTEPHLSQPRIEPRSPEFFMAPSSRPSPFQSPITPRDSSPIILGR